MGKGFRLFALLCAALPAAVDSGAVRIPVGGGGFHLPVLPFIPAEAELANTLKAAIVAGGFQEAPYGGPLYGALDVDVGAALLLNLHRLDFGQEEDRCVLGAMTQFLPEKFLGDLKEALNSGDEGRRAAVARQIEEAYKKAFWATSLAETVRARTLQSVEALAAGEIDARQFEQAVQDIEKFSIYGPEIKKLTGPAAELAYWTRGENDPAAIAARARGVFQDISNSAGTRSRKPEAVVRAGVLAEFGRANSNFEALSIPPVDAELAYAMADSPVNPVQLASIIGDALTESRLGGYLTTSHAGRILLVDMATHVTVFSMSEAVERRARNQIFFHVSQIRAGDEFLRRVLLPYGISVESAGGHAYWVYGTVLPPAKAAAAVTH